MNRLKLTSIVAVIIGSILCIGPLAAIVLGAAGLSWLTPYSEHMAVPLLIIAPAIVFYAVWRDRKQQG